MSTDHSQFFHFTVIVVVVVVIFNEDTNITVQWFTEGCSKELPR